MKGSDLDVEKKTSRTGLVLPSEPSEGASTFENQRIYSSQSLGVEGK